MSTTRHGIVSVVSEIAHVIKNKTKQNKNKKCIVTLELQSIKTAAQCGKHQQPVQPLAIKKKIQRNL